MKFPKWETGREEWADEETQQWLRTLENEHLVDLHLMLMNELEARGFQMPSDEAVDKVAERDEIEENARKLCRKTQ